MRAVSPIKLAIISILLVLAAILVHGYTGVNVHKSAKVPLRQAFTGIGGWHPVREFPMDNRIIDALKLDDYLFRSYGRDNLLVNLYIGYYRTAKKVGAAHDPLICFQGQGWQLSKQDSGEYLLTRSPGLKIHYSSMIAELNGEREMIVYWFQANKEAAANTQSQKVAMVLEKLSGENEDNAFVRISTSIGEETPEAVRKRLFDFIEDFYPGFFRYVTRI
jgi:EpsI family protein